MFPILYFQIINTYSEPAQWGNMYTSQFFSETEPAEVDLLVARHALGILVTHDETGFGATHAPMLFEPGRARASLIGHLARPNPHWRRLADGQGVLAIFRGPDAYVTPSTYAVEPDVPTWNYSAVHVHGRWERIDDGPATREVLDLSVAAYEAVRGSGWDMTEIPASLVEALQRGVVAFRLHVDRIEAAQKLSQDKCRADVDALVSALAACPFGGSDTADAMRRVTLGQGRYADAVNRGAPARE